MGGSDQLREGGGGGGNLPNFVGQNSLTCHFGPKNLDSKAGGSTRVAKCQSYGRYTFVKKMGGSVGEHAYFTRFVRDRVNKERTLKGQAECKG